MRGQLSSFLLALTLVALAACGDGTTGTDGTTTSTVGASTTSVETTATTEAPAPAAGPLVAGPVEVPESETFVLARDDYDDPESPSVTHEIPEGAAVAITLVGADVVLGPPPCAGGLQDPACSVPYLVPRVRYANVSNNSIAIELPQLRLSCTGAAGRAAGDEDDKGYRDDFSDPQTSYDALLADGDEVEGRTTGYALPDECADPLLYVHGFGSGPGSWRLMLPRG